MMFLQFLIVVIGAVQAFENDCIDKCTCQNTAIWCEYIFDQPKLMAPAPEQVHTIYISYSDIKNISFIAQFPNLQKLSLFEVSINCTLLQKATLPRSLSVIAPSCPGIYVFFFFFFFFFFFVIYIQYRILVS